MATFGGQPIATLAPQPVGQPTYMERQYYFGTSGHLLLWFVIIAIIFFFVFYVWKPAALQQTDPTTGLPNGQIDPFKVLIAAVVVALIIVFLIWLFRGPSRM